ncbi:MAG: sterol desaturase family protein [Sediminibacterium sp.]
MNSSLLQFIQPYAIAIAFLVVFIAEHIFPAHSEKKDVWHDVNNFALGVINGGLTFVCGYYFQQLMVYANGHHIGLFQWLHLPFWIALILQIVLIDISMYWWHRLNHSFDWLWRFHKVHHSDKSMNTSTVARFHFMELFLSFIFRIVFFPILGFSVTAILLYSFLFFPVVILHHSNIRISRSFDHLLRVLIVTPRMHRIHHSKKRVECDSNYSSVFPWWDSLFGSYIKEPEGGKVDFGI